MNRANSRFFPRLFVRGFVVSRVSSELGVSWLPGLETRAVRRATIYCAIKSREVHGCSWNWMHVLSPD